MSKRVMVVFGTRPECIKLAPVVTALKARPAEFETIVCSSGQHRELVHQAAEVFSLAIDVDLAVMQPSQALPDLTGKMIAEVARTINTVQPDWVIVQGDTTTAFCAAFAAYYTQRRVAHVEAGLRSGDRFNPFPEEVNRKAIGLVADLHFAPTGRAADALACEGVPASAIHLTGNTIVDALLALMAQLDAPGGDSMIDPKVRRIIAEANDLILVTSHRRESFGPDLAAVCAAIKRLAGSSSDRQFVFPVHLNPAVRAQVMPLLAGLANVHLLDPVGYPDFISLLSHATLVLTDSGGIQEEAPTFGVPVFVLRKKTERPENIAAGFAELVGTDEDAIVARVMRFLENGGERPSLLGTPNPYGDGKAALRIADVLARTS